MPPPGFSFSNDAFAYSGESTGGRRIQIGDAVVADVKAEIRADFLTCGLDDALRIYGGHLGFGVTERFRRSADIKLCG